MIISSKSVLIHAAIMFGIVFSAATGVQAQDPDIEKGKTIFNGVGACAGCHGALGAGDGPAGAALTPKPPSFVTAEYKYDTDADGKTGTEADIVNIVEIGRAHV